MSKKDLLERINRPSDGRSPRRTESEDTRSAEDVVTKRVSRKVVRRRRKASEEPAAEAAPAPKAEPKKAEPKAPAKPAAPAAEKAVEAAPAPPPVEKPVEKPAPEPKPAPVAENKPAEPVVAAPEKKAEPTPEPKPVAEKPVEAKPDAPKPDAPKAEPTPEPVAAAPAEPEKPQRRHPGLGVAVVVPPPGYDPNNPSWRRDSGYGQPKPAAAETTSPSRGRRRVAAGAGPGAGPGRRGSGAGPGARRPSGPSRGRRRGGGGRLDNRFRRKPRRKRSSGPKAASPAPKASKRKVRVDHVISVRDLAKQLQIKASLVIKTLMDMGQMVNITEMLDIDTATLVAGEFEYEVDNVGFQEEEFLQHVEVDDEEEGMLGRPPVVTIMGHVDHGKTTLLDSIRSARVAKGEAGGITQHIGAYQVPVGDSTITFLDTPGHAAFSSMRSRGANVTDIVVLVVAADDGVQPQTKEAIQHAQAAEVPIIVAVNKMDKAGVNPDVVKQQLTEYELIPEEWGGETLFAPISALRGDGIEELLEQIHLQAEILDLKANPDRHAEGVVIEAKMERGRGAVASVLVQQGTLRAGDHVVLGSAFGRVRAMVDHRGKRQKKAGPSTPVELFGLSELPEVGDDLAVVATEKNARKLAEHRADQKKLIAMSAGRKNTLEELYAAAARGQLERLHIILKADVQGTLQAIKAALEKIEIDGTEINVLLAAVGDVTESDVNLAASDDAILLGFNVKLDSKARVLAVSKGVEPQLHTVIYALLDSVESRLKGLLAPEFEQVLNGAAEVRQLFRISKIGTIAGCLVLDGTIGRNDTAKVKRGSKLLWEGPIKQLKRFKDDVREARKGFECGISLDGFNDLEENDLIEAYRLEEIPRD